MADILDKTPVLNTNTEMPICKIMVNPEKLNACIDDILSRLSKLEAAEVQPVNYWISVNEALPIYDGLVLICYNDKRIRLGVYTEDGWYSDEGNPIMEQPDFWARIPEPPNQ